MDKFTERRHNTAPDFVLELSATGVTMQDGTISWIVESPKDWSNTALADILRAWAEELDTST